MMAKKVVNIVKKGKGPQPSNEIFNLNEEIIIGINSKKDENKEKDLKKDKAIRSNSKSKHGKYAKDEEKKKKEKPKNIKKKNLNKKVKVKEKKKKKSSKLLKIFILFFLIIISFAILLISPVFNISKITVENNSKITDEEIISLSGIKIGENTFKYINLDIMEKIKENSFVENVKVMRKYPSEIIIDIVERDIKYYFKVSSKNVYIDSQGYIVEIVYGEKYKVPCVKGFEITEEQAVLGNRLLENDLMNLKKINELYDYAVNNEIHNKIIGFTIDKERIIIDLVGNKTAFIENFTNVNIKMLSLKVVLERTEGKKGEIFLDGQGENGTVLFREDV